MRAGQAKRRRLSTLDTLPEWATEARLDAHRALKERKLTQQEILDDFNTALRVGALAQGITDPAQVPQISRSAFSRASLRLSIQAQRLEDTREIALALAPKLGEVADESLTLLIAETIKTLAHEMLSNAGELAADGETAEMLMFTSRALKHAEEAKRISGDTRRKVEGDLYKMAASKKVDQLAAEAGLSADQVARIRRDVLGVRT